jgi:hypothetical protein
VETIRRVSESAFTHELLKPQRKTIDRLDGRFAGPTMDPLGKYAEYDPQSAAISAAYTAAFLDYDHGDLKFGQGGTYRATNFAIGDKWMQLESCIQSLGSRVSGSQAWLQ